jgi:hypothetical protein
MTTTGQYLVDSHPGVVMIDPKIEINEGTKDFFKSEEFQPSITFVFGESRVYHELPRQPYVDGTWDDDVVESSILSYLNDIAF